MFCFSSSRPRPVLVCNALEHSPHTPHTKQLLHRCSNDVSKRPLKAQLAFPLPCHFSLASNVLQASLTVLHRHTNALVSLGVDSNLPHFWLVWVLKTAWEGNLPRGRRTKPPAGQWHAERVGEAASGCAKRTRLAAWLEKARREEDRQASKMLAGQGCHCHFLSAIQ